MRCMDIPGAGLNRTVPKNLLDRESIRARISQPGAGCMPQIMKSEILDLGFKTSGVESFLDIDQVQTSAFTDDRKCN